MNTKPSRPSRRHAKSASWRLLLTAFLAFSAASPAAAQKLGYQQQFSFSLHNFCDTVPIEFANGRLYLRILTADGERRVMLDTGCSQGIVFQGHPLPGQTEVGNMVLNDVNGRKDTVRILRFPPFSIGRLQLSDYVGAEAPSMNIQEGCDAIIGFDLFSKGLAAKIDVRAGRMVITDRRRAFDGEPGEELPYRLIRFLPHVMVSPFMRHVDQALFDTGQRALYHINAERFRKHLYKSRNVASQVEGTASGSAIIGSFGPEEERQAYFLHLNRLKWGNFAFNDYHTMTTEGASAVGSELLNHGTLVINPFRKRMKFRPYNGADSVRIGNRQSDMWFVMKDGKVFVGMVFEHGKAFKAGARQGDRVLKVNGRDILDLNDMNRVPIVKGQTYTFLLLDERGFNKEVTITKE